MMRRLLPRLPRWPVRLLWVTAAAAVIRGSGYFGYVTPPKQLELIETFAPFWAYSIVWVVAGVIAFAAAWTERLYNIAISLNVSLWAAWGASYVLSSLTGASDRAYLTGAGFWFVAFLLYLVGIQGRSRGDV